MKSINPCFDFFIKYLFHKNKFNFYKCLKNDKIQVLLGSGEGVGWSSPTPSSPHSISSPLANTLKHLALVTPKEEGELFRRQVINE